MYIRGYGSQLNVVSSAFPFIFFHSKRVLFDNRRSVGDIFVKLPIGKENNAVVRATVLVWTENHDNN